MGREKRALLPWVSSWGSKQICEVRGWSRELGGRRWEVTASTGCPPPRAWGKAWAGLYSPLVPDPYRDPINHSLLSSEEDVHHVHDHTTHSLCKSCTQCTRVRHAHTSPCLLTRGCRVHMNPARKCKQPHSCGHRLTPVSAFWNQPGGGVGEG